MGYEVGDLDDIELIRFGFSTANANTVPLSLFSTSERNISQQVDTLFTTTYGHYAELSRQTSARKTLIKFFLNS